MTEVAINDVGLRKWLQKVWGMAGLGAVVIFATSLITPDVAPVMPSALGETPAIPPYQSEASLSEFTAPPCLWRLVVRGKNLLPLPRPRSLKR